MCTVTVEEALGGTYGAVENDDVLFVSSQPRVQVSAEVHQLLQVWHLLVRPRKVCHLHTAHRVTHTHTRACLQHRYIHSTQVHRELVLSAILHVLYVCAE